MLQKGYNDGNMVMEQPATAELAQDSGVDIDKL
jgi:hypothetical protein